MWEVILLDNVDNWVCELEDADYESVAAAIDMLSECGPALGRPFTDLVKGGKYKNMKELRPLGTSIRILFAFDPNQIAVLLVAGDKSGQWKSWYKGALKEAEARYAAWLDNC
ncbi:type II toxin-antitoxin system RelE/ParE family toxin [Gordonia sihwensis]|uniref:type II toxin-antitoxin system RelE/ParE family toxin n=1 Tax=Gordonia sihwensis TaxID=173559 RepID=UPI003D96CCF4